MTTWLPTAALKGALPPTVTVVPTSLMSKMLTRLAMSLVNPTAPLYLNAECGRALLGKRNQLELSTNPSVVAGSPGCSVPAGVLNVDGNSVPGSPFAMSARPDNGPKENIYVWVPSAI